MTVMGHTNGRVGVVARAWAWVLHPPVSGPRATMVIRMMAGGVFLWEGILKFVYANQGVGRFFLGTSPLPAPPSPPLFGPWAVLHEIRSEYAQLLTVTFLLINGPAGGRSTPSPARRVAVQAGEGLRADAADLSCHPSVAPSVTGGERRHPVSVVLRQRRTGA